MNRFGQQTPTIEEESRAVNTGPLIGGCNRMHQIDLHVLLTSYGEM